MNTPKKTEDRDKIMMEEMQRPMTSVKGI